MGGHLYHSLGARFTVLTFKGFQVFRSWRSCYLPEIQSAKLCIRLQFARHIRTCSPGNLSLDPDATICQLADRHRSGGSRALQNRQDFSTAPAPERSLQTVSAVPLNHHGWRSPGETDAALIKTPNPHQVARMRSLDPAETLRASLAPSGNGGSVPPE